MPSVAPPPTSVAAITLSVYRAPSCTKVFGVSDHNLPNLPVILGPNITGIFTTHNHYPYLSGAFSSAGTNGVGLGYASTIPVLKLNMDASKCSAIYSKGETVQPSSLVFNYVIKY